MTVQKFLQPSRLICVRIVQPVELDVLLFVFRFDVVIGVSRTDFQIINVEYQLEIIKAA